jgi:hypothetical protein
MEQQKNRQNNLNTTLQSRHLSIATSQMNKSNIAQQNNTLKPNTIGLLSKSRYSTPSTKAVLLNASSTSMQSNSNIGPLQSSINTLVNDSVRMPTPSRAAASRSTAIDPSTNVSRLTGTQSFSVSTKSNMKSSSSSSETMMVGRNLNLNMNKPPPAPALAQQNQSNFAVTPTTKKRVPLAYGSQRSATTSVVPSTTTTFSNTTTFSAIAQQKKAQQQAAVNKQQKQVTQKTASKILNTTTNSLNSTSSMIRTSTNHSIASCNSSTTSAYVSATSPSSMSSLSASSSIQQIAPINASSPRSSRSTSSNQINNNNNKNMSPPSAAMTRQLIDNKTVVQSARERSTSPSIVAVNNTFKRPIQPYGGSITNLNESKIPQSPLMNSKKQLSNSRRSFLPQPVQFSQQQIRKQSISPIRTTNPHTSSTGWQDGCY